MRRTIPGLAILLVVVAIVAAACGGSSASDPYALLSDSLKTARNPVQINVGVSATDGTDTIAIDPASIGIVVDSEAGTGAVHLSLAASDLGLDAATLASFGVTGSTIDFDLLYDGEGLYVRSPLAGVALTFLLAGSGELPSGDLSGWLRFGTKDELAAIMAALGGSATPQLPVPSALAAPELKSTLEKAGVTLAVKESATRVGVNATRIEATVDVDKLLASDMFSSAAPADVADMASALKEANLSADIWVDPSAKQVVEVDVHVVSKSDSTQKADFTVTFKDPDGSVAEQAPSTFVDVPIQTLIQDLMQMLGQGMLGG